MPAVKGFKANTPIAVRLRPDINTVLGAAADATFELYAAETVDGWLQADYRHPNGAVDRYVFPPGTVMYLKQRTQEGISGPQD